jgi:hypothetical protein
MFSAKGIIETLHEKYFDERQLLVKYVSEPIFQAKLKER